MTNPWKRSEFTSVWFVHRQVFGPMLPELSLGNPRVATIDITRISDELLAAFIRQVSARTQYIQTLTPRIQFTCFKSGVAHYVAIACICIRGEEAKTTGRFHDEILTPFLTTWGHGTRFQEVKLWIPIPGQTTV